MIRSALAASALIAGPASAAADPAKYIRAELIAETIAPGPGSGSLIGIRMTPRSGWHGYWSNAGDSGFAPSVRWTAPKGVTFGPLLHPAPSLLTVSGLTSFVHDGPHVLVARVTVPRSVQPGTKLPISAAVRWAACTATQCVPLRATLKLALTVGDGAPGNDARELRAAVRKLPRAAPVGRMIVGDKFLRLKLPRSLRLDPRRTRFFPDTNGALDVAATRSAQSGGAIVLSAPRRGAVPRTLSGVVGDGRSAYRLTFVRA